MKWIVDRIKRLIAAYSQKSASGHEPTTPADPNQTDLVPGFDPPRPSKLIEANLTAKRITG
jgi:hypothetical protein